MLDKDQVCSNSLKHLPILVLLQVSHTSQYTVSHLQEFMNEVVSPSDTPISPGLSEGCLP